MFREQDTLGYDFEKKGYDFEVIKLSDFILSDLTIFTN